LLIGALLLGGGAAAARERITAEMPKWQEIARISGARIE